MSDASGKGRPDDGMNGEGAMAAVNDPTLMRSIIQRIATGPELSKDITRDEARRGMRLVLDGAVDPVQSRGLSHRAAHEARGPTTKTSGSSKRCSRRPRP